MKKENLRVLIQRHQEIAFRIGEIADACEREKRERTDAETAEYSALSQEAQVLSMRMHQAATEHMRAYPNPNAMRDAETLIRENVALRRATELIFSREIMVVADAQDGGIVPLNVVDIIRPLSEGFILDKVGLPFYTGLSGDFVWPLYELVEATVLGETAEFTDSKISLSKLTSNAARIGVAVPMSYKSIEQTDGLLEMIVREVMPLAVRELLNKILFSCAPVNDVAKTSELMGPFARDAAHKTKIELSSTPTFEELNVKMKAKVLESGILGDHLCWVMTKSLKAKLEGTPISKDGIFIPMIQNDILCGLPVHTTNHIAETKVKYKKRGSSKWEAHELEKGDTIAYEFVEATEEKALEKLNGVTKPKKGEIAKVVARTERIGLGDWRLQPMGLFGGIHLTVDPFSKARQHSVDFVLNAEYGTKTLRDEAFILGELVADAESVADAEPAADTELATA